MPQRNVERQARISTLAPVFGATIDGRATADNARGLMITLLGEFVLPTGGSAWTRTLIHAMELLGVQPKTTRQVLARLADRGWLDRTKDGRRTRWHLTEHSTSLLRDGAERIYGFGHDGEMWDGRWLVLLASLPERDQHQRYRMTTGLTWAGFGSLGQGTWLSPWTRRESQAVAVVDELGIGGATSFVAEIGALGDGADLAARAWDLDELRRHYDDFLDVAPSLDADLPGDVDNQVGDGVAGDVAVQRLATVVHRWRRFPFLDPDLPPQLLPAGWPGHLAVRRFEELRMSLLPSASAWWQTVDADGDPTTPDNDRAVGAMKADAS